MTLMSEVRCCARLTMTCGSMARFLMRSTISFWISTLVQAGGADHAGEGNGDVAAVIDGLIGEGDEIARPRAGVERDEKAARGRLEDCRRDDVADAEFDVGGGATVGKGAGQTFRLIGRENVHRFGRELDQRVGRRLRFLGEHVNGGRPIGRKKAAAAKAYRRRRRQGDPAQSKIQHELRPSSPVSTDNLSAPFRPEKRPASPGEDAVCGILLQI